MTSNIGARHLQNKAPMGFHGSSTEFTQTKAEQEVQAEVKRTFNPEFLNRIDETIIFGSLTDENLREIVQMLVGQINQNLIRKEIQIKLNDDAAQYILDETLGDRSYGARPLRRALQRFIEDPLSEALIQGNLPRPAELEIYRGADGIYYRPVERPEQAGAEDGAEGESSEGAEGEGGVAVAQGTLLYSF